LIAGATYLKLAPQTNLIILDDSETIGGVWSEEKIYPNLFAQVGHGLFEYSSYPMKAEGITEDRYISGRTIHNYLNDFAKDNDLVSRTRLQTSVTKVEKLESGEWKLTISESHTITCEKLIYATGATSKPYVPSWPNHGFTKPIIHSSEVGQNLKPLQEIERATVVGAAKSSYDTVFLLLKAGKKVDWIIRDEGSGPLAIMPPRLFKMFNTVDVMATRAMSRFSPSIMQTDGLWYKFLQKTRVGRFVTMTFWRNVNRIAEYHAGYSKSDNASKLRPTPFGYGYDITFRTFVNATLLNKSFSVLWANAGLGLASVPHFWKTFHKGDVTVHRTEIERFEKENGIVLTNGTKLLTDEVILCTGFLPNLTTFSDELREQYNISSEGDLSPKARKLDLMGEQTVNELLPLLENPPDTERRPPTKRPSRLYRCLISPTMAEQGDRSIYFPGLIHSVFTPLVAEIQALWGIAFMLGKLDLPSQEEMELDVATWNVWSRKRYLEQGRKHAYAIYDYLSVSHFSITLQENFTYLLL
jgi:dimethylaniline monooxygenase (N-oxide forming)